ncbi:EamA family transporter [Parapedobacter sp. ISTM3]|uniref:Chloramphenicol-sensitive protein RarD n=1 Tax=Parapedobacter luteus TaxID=623280 RepID=A0A1T5EM92_9SPHI|nr:MULTISPECIES: EamA family transporter [Parapedobacter]MBK1441305.1 EamA family transporter [Parapedobacter sp. ISTM3]SKB85061.1 chloramphenicol-sensitive protein RarD [Parapedobacter luteus]
MQGRIKYFSAAFFAAALWGFMSIPLRAIKAWPAGDILYYRIFVSVFFIWLFIFAFRRRQLRADVKHIRQLSPAKRKQLGWLMFIASLLIMGNWFAFIYAVNHVSIQSAAFAYLVCPLITTLAGFLILKEGLSTIKKVSIGIAFISVAMLARGSFYEVSWSVGIASFYALYLVAQRIIQQVDKLNVLAAQLTICSLLIVPLLLWQQHPVPLDPKFWLNIIIIAIIFTIIPLYMSMYALNGLSSSTVGIMIYINPIIAFVVAVVYFHEHINTHQLLAYCVLLMAVFLFNWGALRKVFHKFA